MAMSDPTITPCPACGIPCTLAPLKRAGGYRLVDPDGQCHAPVCLFLRPAPDGGGYRREDPLPAEPVARPYLCPHDHDYAVYGRLTRNGLRCGRCHDLLLARARWLTDQRRADRERQREEAKAA